MRYAVLLLCFVLFACSDDSNPTVATGGNVNVADSSQIVTPPDWGAASLDGAYRVEIYTNWFVTVNGNTATYSDNGRTGTCPVDVRRNGSYVWIELRGYGAYTPSGEWYRFLGTMSGSKIVGNAVFIMGVSNPAASRVLSVTWHRI